MSDEPFKCDHSMLDDCDTCLRKCYFKHIKGLVNVNRRGALQYGSAMHKAADAFHEGKPVNEAVEAFRNEMPKDEMGEPKDIDDKRSVKRGEVIIRDYYAEWQSQPNMEVVEMEKVRLIKLKTNNILTGEPLDINYYGKLDKILKVGDGVTWRDHKTTSLFIADYTKRARDTHQYPGYSEIIRQDFPNAALAGTVDAIHIPRVYKDKTGKPTDTIRTQYNRIPVSYAEMQIEEWRQWVYMMVNRWLLHASLNQWPQSKSRCWDFNSSCEFHELCEMPMTHERQAEQAEFSNDFEVERWEPWKGDEG